MNDVILTDLFGVKYNESPKAAKATLKKIIKMKAPIKALIVPESLVKHVPSDWRVECKGQAYAAQGIFEDAYIARYGH